LFIWKLKLKAIISDTNDTFQYCFAKKLMGKGWSVEYSVSCFYSHL